MKKKSVILLVEDHHLVRSAIIRLLSSFHLRVEVHQAENGRDAIDFMRSKPVDLVLLDIQMPVQGGVETLRQIRELKIQTRVIILTQFIEPALIKHLVELGAKGFLSKSCKPEELENAITQVINDGHYYSKTALDVLRNRLLDKQGAAQLDVSPREFQVMILLKDGKTNKEISSRLGLALRTIESYRKSLMKKMNCRNATELVSLAFRTGIS